MQVSLAAYASCRHWKWEKHFFLFQNLVCCSADVLEGKGLVQVAITVAELLRFHAPRSPLHTSSVSVVVWGRKKPFAYQKSGLQVQLIGLFLYETYPADKTLYKSDLSLYLFNS